jgi:DNA-binding GntR family transcriptional regulator
MSATAGTRPQGFLQATTPTTLKAHVYDLLRAAIISGKFRPGTRLNESKLAREFNISRIPIREALTQLRENGLVMSHERRGTFVTELTDEDVQRINSLRVVLESEALKLCQPRMTSKVAERLTSLVHRMERGNTSTEIDSASLDLEFHRTIWQTAGNPYLAKALDSLSTVLFAHTALRSTARESQPWRLNHHREILEVALGRSDVSPERAVINHLSVYYDDPVRFSSYADEAAAKKSQVPQPKKKTKKRR